ncbi:uncharacterized protein LOC106639941 [Copidosoma floridanum]|uniref:uncharacterized protein LOC106639941 n=1 Tax=Copidosoma floridanum TaxID=29053 RepID=UPI0006C9914D|nr:uncharacterized protein LOC106639941 [Copidosoma floridanum]
MAASAAIDIATLQAEVNAHREALLSWLSNEKDTTHKNELRAAINSFSGAFTKVASLKDLDLEIKTMPKFLPRILINSIPVEYTKDEIHKYLMAQNLNEFKSDEVKIVYMYLAKNKKHSSFILEHINAQSLTAHFQDIQQLIKEHNILILGISKTFLKPELPSHPVCIPGYRLLRHDQVGKGCGGIALYIQESLKSEILDASDILQVGIQPTKAGFWAEVETAIIKSTRALDLLILMSDFNIEWHSWHSSGTNASILKQSLTSLGLERIPFRPTHHTATSDTTIDYICLSDAHLVNTFNQISLPWISGHNVIMVDADAVLNDLNGMNWKFFDDACNVDEKVNLLTHALTEVLDQHAPLWIVKIRNRPALWLNDSIKRLIKDRNQAWRNYKRKRTEVLHSKYKQCRNKVKVDMKNAMHEHHRREFLKCRSTADTWNVVRSLGVIGPDDNIVQLPVSTTELNKHFIDPEFPEPVPLPLIPMISPDNRFYFRHVESINIIKAFSSARSNACGPDGLNLQFLKLCLPAIIPILTNLFDASFQSGVFPNFRPITISCTASKIHEAVALSQILQYFESNNILDRFQSSYRKLHSCHTATISIVDDIRIAMENKKITLMISIDQSRAFDLVNTDLLVCKLIAVGFLDSAASWIRSYLTDRSQTVRAPDGEISQTLFRSSGVPQGSSLSPLLFSMFINDLSAVCKGLNYHLYADDFCFYISGKTEEDPRIVQHAYMVLESILNWGKINGLIANEKKTRATWFGTRGVHSRLEANGALPNIVFNGITVDTSNTIKLLGVTLDSSLTCKPQCASVSSKCFSALARFRRFKDSLPNDMRLLLVRSLVFPHTDYCASIFYGLSAEMETKMSRCLNAALRFVENLRKSDHITSAYKKYGILSYSSRRCYIMLCLLEGILKTGTPSYLDESFSFKSKPSGLRQSNVAELIIIHAELDV